MVGVYIIIVCWHSLIYSTKWIWIILLVEVWVMWGKLNPWMQFLFIYWSIIKIFLWPFSRFSNGCCPGTKWDWDENNCVGELPFGQFSMFANVVSVVTFGCNRKWYKKLKILKHSFKFKTTPVYKVSWSNVIVIPVRNRLVNFR